MTKKCFHIFQCKTCFYPCQWVIFIIWEMNIIFSFANVMKSPHTCKLGLLTDLLNILCTQHAILWSVLLAPLIDWVWALRTNQFASSSAVTYDFIQSTTMTCNITVTVFDVRTRSCCILAAFQQKMLILWYQLLKKGLVFLSVQVPFKYLFIHKLLWSCTYIENF